MRRPQAKVGVSRALLGFEPAYEAGRPRNPIRPKLSPGMVI